MSTTDGSFASYSSESHRLKLSPRCPFASPERCPKYAESIDLLRESGGYAGISEEDRDRLSRKWAGWRTQAPEQSPSYFGSDGRYSFSRICPEVGYVFFGYFAAGFYRYGDVLDSELAHERLAKDHVPSSDHRWLWWSIEPEHYTECVVYSVLATEVKIDSKAGKRRSTKKPIPPSLRWTVLARDSYTCQYCGRMPPEVVLEVDHRVSEAMGGATKAENLVASCMQCNRGKGPRSA